jgi:multiple sugar transport system ATP-binding protein
MPQVALEHVTKIFQSRGKETVAVDDATLKVDDKELLVILGPSGSGKSTLLRLVAGLEYPASGEISIGDRDVTYLPPKDRDIGMVFQSYAIYPFMSVFDNISLPLRLRKVPKREIGRRVEEVARYLGISDLLMRRPHELSGGEMQRVALARCIVRNPTVFLFDEPLSNLDERLRVETRSYLKRLQRELGVTTLYVTHDQEEAMTIADRIVIVDQGRIQQIGTPEEIYQEPANTFVAKFIGTPPINIISCAIEKAEDATYLIHDKIHLRMPEAISKNLHDYDQDEIMLGVRPTAISISKQVPSTGNWVKCRIYLSEFVGRSRYVLLDIDGTLLRAIADPETPLMPGEDVYTTIDFRRDVHFFDKSKGVRLAASRKEA